MYKSLIQWARAPVFEDEDKTRKATLVNLVIFAILGGMIGYALAVILYLPDQTPRLPVVVMMIFSEIGILFVLRKGYVGFAAILITWVVWLGLTYAAFLREGVHSLAFLAYSVVIIMAGLLLDERATLRFTGLSIVSGTLMMIAEGYGIIPVPIVPRSSLSLWTAAVLFFAVSGFLLYLFAGGLNAALRRARDNARMLQDIVVELRREISEREKTEFALLKSEERFRVALKGSHITVCHQDRELRYTWVYNPVAGIPPETIIGKTDADFTTPEMAEAISAVKRKVMETGVGERFEVDAILNDGTRVAVDNTFEALRDEEGQIVGVISASIDVTARKVMEEKLAEVERQRLEMESEKALIRMKEDFISTVSHQFRGPLSVIMVSKDLLEKHYDQLTEERRAKHLWQIGSQAQYMTYLLDRVLTVSKARAGKMEFNPQPLDLESFCRGLVEELELVDQAAHKLVFTSEGHFHDIQADEQLLRHILINLLSNATKYSPAGSEIRFELSSREAEVVFRVSDQGIGIPTEDQAKLFQPFFRAKNSRNVSGVGLGLAIVKESVDTHGGTISCESQVEVGTTFAVSIPK